jgi:phage baseplate assembly protein gpV
VKELGDLFARVNDLERRLSNMVRHGTVHPGSTDPAAGTTRLRLGGTDEEPYLSPPVKYGQVAGALKVHSPPSDNQQMTIFSASGDWRQGIALPMTWSDQNQSPSDKGDEHVMTFGDVTVKLTAGGVTVSVGGVTWTLSSAGEVTEGGEVKHNGKNIGATHFHGGVIPGGGNSDVPAN